MQLQHNFADQRRRRPLHSRTDVRTGITIALVGEQLVENWREYRQYLEAREAMRMVLNYILYDISRRNWGHPVQDNSPT